MTASAKTEYKTHPVFELGSCEVIVYEIYPPNSVTLKDFSLISKSVIFGLLTGP